MVKKLEAIHWKEIGPRPGGVPFFFGPSRMPLFGCFHSPSIGSSRPCGIVLCHPFGQEYIYAHRALRQLAIRLSAAGFPVLRFDFYGCGDSSGTDDEGRIRTWLSDISLAVNEIKRKGGVDNVCLIGLRLGGMLSMLAGAERGDIEGMVIWDPVVNGKEYIRELTLLDDQFIDRHLDTMLPELEKTPALLNRMRKEYRETLNFSLTDSLRADFDSLDIGTIKKKPTARMLVIESLDESRLNPLMAHLGETQVSVEHRCLPSPQVWINRHDEGFGYGWGLVPIRVLQYVVDWCSEVLP